MKIDYENIHEDLLFSLLGAMLWCASTLGNVSDKGAHRCPCLPQVTCAYRTVEEMALLFSQKVSRRMIEALKESWLEIGRERREEESSSCTQQSWGERQERGGLLRGYLPPTPTPLPGICSSLLSWQTFQFLESWGCFSVAQGCLWIAILVLESSEVSGAGQPIQTSLYARVLCFVI